MTTPHTVLVTGASGYIAGWIVKYLLEEGHTVHATVRDPARAESVAPLQALARGTPGTLRLFRADLLQPGSFDAAMQGCDLVMHTASPFVLEGYDNAYEALLRPALEGTRNVLEAASRTASVTRVVLTSSVAAIYGDNADLADSGAEALCEADWNETSTLLHNPYQYSKTCAEREAWRLHELQAQWQLVTLNPGMVYGPALTRASRSASIDTLRQLGDGRLRHGVPDLRYGVVDVRDVARAHLLAAFTPQAQGRYLLVAGEISLPEIAALLRRHYGDAYPFPRRVVPKALAWLFGPLMGPVTRRFIRRNIGYAVRFDNRRSLALGLQYRPLERTFAEHFRQLLEDGLLPHRLPLPTPAAAVGE
jgi:nucleoside-diphosphate-sugar epimerase